LLAAFRVASLIPFLFAKDVAVKLVSLDINRWNIADSGIMENGTPRTNGFKDAQNGFLVQAGQAGCGAYSNAFTKQLDNLLNFLRLDAQSV
jgi:hypothetical protein